MKAYLKWVMPCVQAVISAVLMFMLVSSKLLPGKFLGIAAAVLLVLMAIICLLARSKNGAVSSVASILAIFLSGMLIFGIIYVRHIVKTLEQIAGSDTQTNYIVVAVQDSSEVKEIGETSGLVFGIFEGANKEYTDVVSAKVTEANGDSELDKQVFDSPVEMARELLDGNLDAVICNKAYIDLLDDVVMNYSKLSRIIYEQAFETSIAEDDTDDSVSEQKSTRVGARLPGEKVTEHPFNVLISGIDVSGPISTTSRSDVNIIMSVNPQEHRILLTTTPRDYFVYIPGISGDERDKLTHAGVYGVRTSMKTLEELYDIGISDYVRINFDSLIQLVDALGGIDVNSEVEFSAGGYDFHKGINHMNGEQALVFSRERYQFGSGDNQRGKNQMQVLTAILDKLQSRELLKNPSEVLDVVGRSMQTSFTTKEIAEVIAWQLASGHGWDIGRQAVEGISDAQETFSMKGTKLSVMWPDESSVKKASDKIKEIME